MNLSEIFNNYFYTRFLQLSLRKEKIFDILSVSLVPCCQSSALLQLKVENEHGEVSNYQLKALQANTITLESGDNHHYIFSAAEPFQVKNNIFKKNFSCCCVSKL